ncbi:MAG: hypothetical protein CVV64_06230 [Candidatus Wallbacteria bacterium HGW-Wallbacteria-1]|jgi:hypothetical protein|uniref:Carboxypeptidase regulatory-like domain-containing protein n=1 Tax=Candidatus Wallbacteria bacterium HGW-Wallbacteria-1 TaxID=2013854 RepID=A0A2N1PSW3_9BACT|nr:MAG: hypothetical protein CVV64_06230 [Candidatus Wallbacteria bacterium HGW-Wallbacteria-1]
MGSFKNDKSVSGVFDCTLNHFAAGTIFSVRLFLFLCIAGILTGMVVPATVLATTFYTSGLTDDGNETLVTGTVSNSLTMAAISNVVVAIGDQHTLTNDDGVFRIAGLTRGVFKILVSRDGFEDHLDTVSLSAPEEKMNIKLAPISNDATAVSRVFDAETGKPIRGAWVTVGSRSGVTDSKGYVRIERIQLSESNKVTAGAYGYLTYSRPVGLERGTFDLEIYLEKPQPSSDEKILRSSPMPLNPKSVSARSVTGQAAEESEGGQRRPGRLAVNVKSSQTVTGVTGLFNHIDARVLGKRHFAMGVGIHPTSTGPGSAVSKGDIKSLRFSLGLLDGLEVGMSLLNRDLETSQGDMSSTSRVINLKYSLSKLSGPMKYAVGYQRINVSDSSSNAVNSVYFSTDFKLDTALLSNRLSANLMFSDTAGSTMTRLNLGIESRVLSWTRPYYMIFEAEQDGDNEFNILNFGFRYKKNPVFDLYLSHDIGHETTSLGTGMTLRF